MAGMIKKTVGKVTANPVGALAGGAVAFFAAKKYMGVTKWYYLAAVTLAGVVVGASAQSMIQSKKGAEKSGATAKGK